MMTLFTSKLIQDLENDFGRKQLCTPRLLDAETDIAVGIKECSDGFDVINNKSQVRLYALVIIFYNIFAGYTISCSSLKHID